MPIAKIFAEGDPSVYLYLVVSGKIRISREERKIFHAVPNDSFGLVGLVEERRRATHATALSDSTLLRIGHSDLFDLMEDYPAITRGVLRGQRRNDCTGEEREYRRDDYAVKK